MQKCNCGKGKAVLEIDILLNFIYNIQFDQKLDPIKHVIP
jgi:hypothetical protein